MKRFAILSLVLSLTVVTLASCGVPQKEYDALEAQYKRILSNYNALIDETQDWKAMDADQKAAMAAEAATARAAAEEIAAAVAAEQAAVAAAKAEEDRVAAVEAAEAEAAANKGKITLQELLLEPDVYVGELVHITSDLVLVRNTPDRKSFTCYLYKEIIKDYGSYDSVDSNFALEVFYDEMSDWKTWGSLSGDHQRIRVSGTVYIYADHRGVCYLSASEITIVG